MYRLVFSFTVCACVGRVHVRSHWCNLVRDLGGVVMMIDGQPLSSIKDEAQTNERLHEKGRKLFPQQSRWGGLRGADC